MAKRVRRQSKPWTAEEISTLLTSMMDDCENGIKKGGETKTVYYIGQILDKHGLHGGWWSAQTNKCQKYSEDETREDREDYLECFDLFKLVEQKIEGNLVRDMLSGKVKETTGIFTLKAKHKWKDRQEISHEHEVKPISISFKIDRG